MKRQKYIALIVLSAAIGLLVCTGASGQEAMKTQSDKALVQAGSVLGVGDILEIRIPVAPELSKQYTIPENGRLYFPVLEDINLGVIDVANANKQCTCTTREIEQILKTKLAEYFQPEFTEVTVDLVTIGVRIEYSVYVYGAVGLAGSSRYYDGMRLLDALLKVGGLAENADLAHVRLTRNGKRMADIDVTEMMAGTDYSANIDLLAGDIVVVPKIVTKMIKVTALGRLTNIGTYSLPESSKALDIMIAAGGPAGRAGIGRAYIVRMVDNRPTAIHVDFKSMFNRMEMAQNIPLQDGDIFFMPESSGPNISQLLNTLTMFEFVRSIVRNP